MLECSRICIAANKGLRVGGLGAALALAACATQPPEQPVAVAPAPVVTSAPKAPAVDPRARAEEAAAFLAQAETDVQRARARRALWAKAWESLVGARTALAANDHAGAIARSKRASEFAQLGLEQLAYPAVKPNRAWSRNEPKIDKPRNEPNIDKPRNEPKVDKGSPA
jgi:hypothetical protein